VDIIEDGIGRRDESPSSACFLTLIALRKNKYSPKERTEWPQMNGSLLRMDATRA